MTAGEALAKTIGVTFKNEDLLTEALTHRSYLNEYPKWRLPHNERMEYLGDAVLELIVSEELFHKFPERPEGQLTVLRAALVNYQILAKIAEQIGLQDYILLSRGEKKDTGKAREVILANAMEALIGAIYLDQNMDAVRPFVKKFVMNHLDDVLKTKSYRDSKSELQELVQEKMKITPTYNVLGESGPAHKRVFTMGVFFGDKLIAKGEGSSKQEAETEAAKNALKKSRQ
ncbi:MAG TPA: ribonuclease III [Candidatus Paceibacterota bacterium]|nr:ribonuclease III [Candidatus Paceibacterota bacterium]